jgi:hypothetical protein
MKRLLYDSGMQVPMIIRFPNQYRAGEIDDQLVSFIDFKPTIMSLVGIEPPAYLKGQGQAFLGPYKADAPRDYVHGAGDRFDGQYDLIRAVRDKRFKYLRNYMPDRGYYLPVKYREQMPLMQELLKMRDAGTLDEVQMQWFRPAKPIEELFDTANDPHEVNNLAADPAYVEKLAELRAEHDRWIVEIEDKGLQPEADYIDSIWPGRIQPEVKAPMHVVEDGNIVLRTASEGASIGYQYVKDGMEPGDSWSVYTAPLPAKRGHDLLIMSDAIGYKASEIVRVD